jgi:hypothetical protein
MTNGTDVQINDNAPPEDLKLTRCFVIMPFSSSDGYDVGHFDRVYNHIIKPACKLAGVVPERTDDGLESGYILAKMLKMLTEYELAICDMSAVNANVFYELGVRQAFGKPVTLIKDEKSRRIFDVQGFSSIEYDSTLRIDKVQSAVNNISQALKETLYKKDEIVNSIQPFLEMNVAKKPEQVEVSLETAIILDKIAQMERHLFPQKYGYQRKFDGISDAIIERDIDKVNFILQKLEKNKSAELIEQLLTTLCRILNYSHNYLYFILDTFAMSQMEMLHNLLIMYKPTNISQEEFSVIQRAIETLHEDGLPF